ncbi:MAG TPA: AAA family ATPase [Candidatus Binataceae bacterium]
MAAAANELQPRDLRAPEGGTALQNWAGMAPGENQMASQTRSGRSASPGTAEPVPGVPSPHQKGVFRKEAEYWTVGCGEQAFRLRDTRGLGYLAHLLRHPGVEFHVLDLFAGIASRREEDETSQSVRGLPRRAENLEKAGIHVSRLGDAGEMLDEQAKVAYRRRLAELREELEGARALGEVERARRAQEEADALTKELARAVGLGGRNRRAASAAERARQSITKAIKAALERIAHSDAALGKTLSRCIRTGNFCAYQPDPDFPIGWEFAAAPAQPADQPTSSADRVPARADHPPAALASPLSLAERTAFVGREPERFAIRAAIDRALNGHGSLVMLGGGFGVGKTRLTMEMAEYSSQFGFRCSVGRCYEGDEPFSYLPFVEIIESNLAQAASLDDYRRQMGDNAAELARLAPSLRRIFPDIPQPPELPPAQRRGYLFQSVSEALAGAARTRSQLYILEDLQWADESTLALLIHLANRVARLPVVIIGIYRDGYTDHNPALGRTLEELIRLGVRPLKLSGLSKDAVAAMLDGLSRRPAPESLVNLIFEESQGNPFFVEELYRHLIEKGKVFDAAGQFRNIESDEIEVPENVRLIIGRRLERLDRNEKRVLAAAAVIGRRFSFQLLTATSQIDADQLFAVIEKAQRLGIIAPISEGPEQPFFFTHELVRQTILAGISAPRRQRLHAGVVQAMELAYPGAVNDRAGEIADHLLKAGPFAGYQTRIHRLPPAGGGAFEAAAFEPARRSFASALAHQGAAGFAESGDLLASLAMAERGLQRRAAMLARLREALEIYLNPNDRKIIARGFGEPADSFLRAPRLREAAQTAGRRLTCLQGDVGAEPARLPGAPGHALAAAAGYERPRGRCGKR